MEGERLRLFVASAPGLEPLLRTELEQLGIADAREVVGGVSCFGSLEDVYRINVGCGLGLRVLVRIAEFFARDFRALERVARSLAWERWLHPRRGVRVRAHSKRSRLYHTKAIAERIERGISARTRGAHELHADTPAQGPGGGEVGAGDEPTLIQVRFVRDRCTISVDTTGTMLHKRGWRQAVGKAPLREDIARALLISAGWRPGMALVDPTAGAGTLVIEAATWAAGLSPGHARRFVCMGAPGFDPTVFARVRESSRRPPVAGPTLLGRDRDAGAVRSATANAERAGVGDATRFVRASLGELEVPELAEPEFAGGPGEPVAVVANLPWGVRTGDPSRLRNLYATFGKFARRLAEGRSVRVGLVSNDSALAHATGLGLERQLATDQGGAKIGLWAGGVDG